MKPLSRKSLKVLKKMAHGCGLFKATIDMPDGQKMDILFKMNGGKTKFVCIYKDGNRLGKRQNKLYKKIADGIEGN